MSLSEIVWNSSVSISIHNLSSNLLVPHPIKGTAKLLKLFSSTMSTILFADNLVDFSDEFQNISIPATCIIPLQFK